MSRNMEGYTSEASYKREEGVSLLIPLAHRASLLTALLAEVLYGLFMSSVGVSKSSRICLQSLKSCLCGGNRWSSFVERHRGQVPLNIDEGGFNVRRFATRALACGERVRCPTILSKIVDKTPDDRGWNRRCE